MTQIRDALELLTAQHEELDQLLERVVRTGDADTFTRFADKLATHLAIEQELLYPIVAKLLSRAVLEEMFAEHAAINRALSDLVWRGVDDADFDARLDDLATVLAGHIAWQENELFISAAETISMKDLATLCERVHAFDTVAAAAAA